MLLNQFCDVIPSDNVQPRDYFLKVLQEPYIIWGIRITAVLLAALIVIIYLKMRKKKNKNGEI